MLEAMGWIVLGCFLFALYALLTLFLAPLGAAMDGSRKRPPTRWTTLRLWLIMLTYPLWGPIGLLIYGPVLLGRRMRRGGNGRSSEVRPGGDLP